MERVAETRFDLVVLDHHLPDGVGLDCLPTLLKQDRSLPVVYVTASTDSQTAIEAMKAGAFDYLSKPIDFDRLKSRIHEALQCRKLTRIPVVVPRADETKTERMLVGSSAAMQEVYKAIGRFAPLDVPVLISGEVGTGRELIARSIYRNSQRAEKPFARISCCDFSADELGRELFGATTDLGGTIAGWLAQFHGATLLIEELQAMPLAVQSRLLRVLRDRQLMSREDATAVPADVRVLLSVTGDIDAMVRQGIIRSDLFYFLNAYTIRVPPLRDRQTDLEQLVNHFTSNIVKVSSTVDGGTHPRISPEVMRMLKSYRWPGNVAELQSVLQRVLVEANGAIVVTDSLRHALGLGSLGFDPRLSDLASNTGQTLSAPNNSDPILAAEVEVSDAIHNVVSTSDETSDTKLDLAEMVKAGIEAGSQRIHDELMTRLETKILEEVLKHTSGNQAQAARLLGITRTSLRRKIASGGIDLSRFAPQECLNPSSVN
jgi:two-component system nitrogen regulation response regulator GlnG